MSPRTSRVEARQGADVPTRLRLLETDADSLESDVSSLEQMLNRRLGRQTAVLMGILISVTTASILLALNLLAGGVAP